MSISSSRSDYVSKLIQYTEMHSRTYFAYLYARFLCLFWVCQYWKANQSTTQWCVSALFVAEVTHLGTSPALGDATSIWLSGFWRPAWGFEVGVGDAMMATARYGAYHSHTLAPAIPLANLYEVGYQIDAASYLCRRWNRDDMYHCGSRSKSEKEKGWYQSLGRGKGWFDD